MKRQNSIWTLLALLVVLSGCDPNVSSPPPTRLSKTPSLSETKSAAGSGTPQSNAYVADGVLAPFSPMRRWLSPELADGGILKTEKKAVVNLLHERSLDNMVYVGYLERGRERIALLRVEGQVLTVKAGERLGLERARVKHVGATAVDLVFQVEGSAGRSVAVLPRLMLQGQKNEK
jgi:Tfp pilus assembly protein PilP